MKKATFVAVLTFCVWLFISDSANAQTRVDINAATDALSGEKVRGPADIQIRNLNILRYDVQIGQTVTFSAGPDLTLPFIPPVPTQPAQTSGQSAGASAATDIPALFRRYRARLDRIETDRVSGVQIPIVTAIDATNLAKDNLESLLLASDSVLITGGGPDALIAATRRLVEPAATSPIGEALNQRWPDIQIEEILGRLDVLENNVLSLPTADPSGGPTWSDWYQGGNKTDYDSLIRATKES